MYCGDSDLVGIKLGINALIKIQSNILWIGLDNKTWIFVMTHVNTHRLFSLKDTFPT